MLLQLLDKDSQLKSTVFKLAHHGAYENGKNANDFKLLDKVKPQAAFVSADPSMSNKHPRCAVIEHLKQ